MLFKNELPSFWKPLDEDILDCMSVVHFVGGALISVFLRFVFPSLISMIFGVDLRLSSIVIKIIVAWCGFIWECLDYLKKIGVLKWRFLDGRGASLVDIIVTYLGGSICADLPS